MKTTSHPPLCAALLLLSMSGGTCSAALSPLTADEVLVLEAVKRAHPGTRFTSAARTPIPDLYEVWMGANVAFVSRKKPRYLLFGRVFDTRTMTDLTAPKLARAAVLPVAADAHDAMTANVPVAQLPIEDAITSVRGAAGDSGRHLFVFSDPACLYCQRLEAELDKLANVTVHTFLLPFQGNALPAAIWCAGNRQQAWRSAMLGSAGNGRAAREAMATPGAADCALPLERNVALAKRLGIRGTPTIIYPDGSRTAGYSDAAAIEARLGTALAMGKGTMAAAPDRMSKHRLETEK